MSKLAITLKRSMIGCRESQRATLKALGLQKREKCVVQPDNASIRGMIDTVSHLVEVKEVE